MRTPVRTPHDSSIHNTPRPRRHSEICELDRPIFVGEDIRALDIAMDNTLVVQVHQTLQDLRDIHRYEVFWELAKLLDDVVEGSILAEPR